MRDEHLQDDDEPTVFFDDVTGEFVQVGQRVRRTVRDEDSGDDSFWEILDIPLDPAAPEPDVVA